MAADVEVFIEIRALLFPAGTELIVDVVAHRRTEGVPKKFGVVGVGLLRPIVGRRHELWLLVGRSPLKRNPVTTGLDRYSSGGSC
jgi:hypothetical protein